MRWKKKKFTKGLVGLNPRGKSLEWKNDQNVIVVQGRRLQPHCKHAWTQLEPTDIGEQCLAGGKYKMT